MWARATPTILIFWQQSDRDEDVGEPLRRAEFAVVDVETTGLFARAYDRVIEIAIVSVDGDGEWLDEYATLVNPERDLGRTDIHGIRGSDVREAPRFEDILGDVSERLRGRVPVAHNARFDRDFLAAEFARCGHVLPEEDWLCTMQLGGAATGARRLGACCDALGISLSNAHSALDDACAAAAVLIACLGNRRLAVDVLPLLASATEAADVWPDVAPCGLCVRRGAVEPRRASFVTRLLDLLPDVSEAAAADARTAYLELLDRALEDRQLTAVEVDSLHELAGAWGLGRAMVESLHRRYFEELLRLARADDIVTDAERADLETVAAVLALPPIDVEAAAIEPSTLEGLPRAESLAGASVCFTGVSTCFVDGEALTRDRAELLARARGLVVKDAVTKALDLLVVADPDSLSGKAKKARAYGTRIMAERAFWHAVGVDVD